MPRAGQPTAIDLFAGAGGLSTGFAQAGFRLVQAVEQHPAAAATYRLNHPQVDVLTEDIAALDPGWCLHRAGLRPGQLTVLIGGPPCQGFSESNRRTRTLDNPKNRMYRHFFRFLRALRPEWAVIENVAGVATIERGRVLKNIVQCFRRAGYAARPTALNAAEYGVPQVRRRMFIIARRVAAPGAPHLPAFVPTHGPPIVGGATAGGSPGPTLPLQLFVTVDSAISDLPVLANGASVDVLRYGSMPITEYQRLLRAPRPNATAAPALDRGGCVAAAGDAHHVTVPRRAPPPLAQIPPDHTSGHLVTNNAAYVVERYQHISAGGNWSSIPATLMTNYADSSRCHTGIYHRLVGGAPSKVIGNFRKNMLIHPSQDRGLSVREAARLQSFPDWYRFRGSIGQQQQQVADAVPPLLAQVVAAGILEAARAAAPLHSTARSRVAPPVSGPAPRCVVCHTVLYGPTVPSRINHAGALDGTADGGRSESPRTVARPSAPRRLLCRMCTAVRRGGATRGRYLTPNV